MDLHEKKLFIQLYLYILYAVGLVGFLHDPIESITSLYWTMFTLGYGLREVVFVVSLACIDDTYVILGEHESYSNLYFGKRQFNTASHNLGFPTHIRLT